LSIVTPSSHYDYWKKVARPELSMGNFWENFTTRAQMKTLSILVDRFSIGAGGGGCDTTPPPLLQLGLRFEWTDGSAFPPRADERALPFVTREGDVGAVTNFHLIARGPTRYRFQLITDLYVRQITTRRRGWPRCSGPCECALPQKLEAALSKSG